MKNELQSGNKENRNRTDAQQILAMSKIGLWRVETSSGMRPCFYADEAMDSLLGIEEPMTPEERFVFHREHIHPEDMDLFLEYSRRLFESRTEIVYRYIHPVKGELFIRCSGTRDTSVTVLLGFIRIFRRRFVWKKATRQNSVLQRKIVNCCRNGPYRSITIGSFWICKAVQLWHIRFRITNCVI